MDDRLHAKCRRVPKDAHPCHPCKLSRDLLLAGSNDAESHVRMPPLAEIIFINRGLSPGAATMSRQRWKADYARGHIWASTSEIDSELRAPEPSEEERQVHADKVRRERAARKRAKAKARKKEAGASEEQEERDASNEEQTGSAGGSTPRGVIMTKAEREQGEEAQDAFESLLAELKAAPDPSPTPGRLAAEVS